MRSIADFAAAHIPGALSIELRPVFSSWLGWLVEPDQPLIFVIAEDQDRADLVRQCLTVGYEQLVGELDGGLDAWRAAGLPFGSIELVDSSELGATVLDVRQDNEYETGHIPGVVHVELGALPDAPLPQGPVTVMCGHGERAMTGASILGRRGCHDLAVLAGGPGDWSVRTGMPLETSV